MIKQSHNLCKNITSNYRKFTYSLILPVIGIFIIPACANAGDNSEELDQKKFDKAMNAYLEDGDNVENLSTAIQSYFNKKRLEEAQSAQKAQAKKLEEQFKNPVDVEVGDSPFKGPKDAKVTIVEFSDFQCPYCSKGKAIMDEILEAYPKDVKVVFKHLPLAFHPQAMPASKAAIAAGNQGKFWEMHDMLFDNQSKLADSYYEEAAKELGLDLEKFKKDFADPKTEKIAKDDLAQAKKLGVKGTPNFFINGVHLRGAYPVPQFKQIIDRLLKEKK